MSFLCRKCDAIHLGKPFTFDGLCKDCAEIKSEPDPGCVFSMECGGSWSKAAKRLATVEGDLKAACDCIATLRHQLHVFFEEMHKVENERDELRVVVEGLRIDNDTFAKISDERTALKKNLAIVQSDCERLSGIINECAAERYELNTQLATTAQERDEAQKRLSIEIAESDRRAVAMHKAENERDEAREAARMLYRIAFTEIDMMCTARHCSNGARLRKSFL